MDNTVNAIWLDGNLPELEQVCLASWLHHGHKLRLWTYGDVHNAPMGVELADASDLWPGEILRYQNAGHERSPVLHANLFRLKFMAERGGIFIDSDTLCLHDAVPLDDSLEISTEWWQDQWHINLAWCKAKPYEPLFVKSCELAEKRLFVDRNFSRGFYGPKMMKQVVAENRLQPKLLHPDAYCELGWDRVCDMFHADCGLSERAIGAHFWSNLVRKRCLLSTQHHPDSLYQKAKRAYLPAC